MISFDFEYYRPSTIQEAVEIFTMLDSQGKKPVYYGGGTEIITFARVNRMYTEAVIDIKEIPECKILEFKDSKLAIGSAMTLSKIREANMFQLLSDVIRRTSDHTSRNKITIGGNICSAIPYRETVLPLLLCDSELVIAGSKGIRYVKINDALNESLKLQKGEFVVLITTDKCYLNLPHINIRRTANDSVDYPLLSVAALIKDNSMRIAFSGVCGFPFRNTRIEEELNKRDTSLDCRIDNAIANLPGGILSDIRGSAEYREFVLRNTLEDLIEMIGGMQ